MHHSSCVRCAAAFKLYSLLLHQVGVHELLGHGSGKLFHQDTPEAAQLVESKFVCPVNGEPVTGPFYPAGSTWDSTFGKMASPYEECRAECAGLYLCLESEVLGVFGHDEIPAEGVHDIVYINWLLMVHGTFFVPSPSHFLTFMCSAGVKGLEMFTPETQAWRQAHMQVTRTMQSGILTIYFDFCPTIP